ncbi:PREDICTED: uncharacterized protein LOC109363626 [Lupinus angustifolius]|uniref:uncharacterized protein LOC109363626 n=1 Tax=Lupinus angustifolius TaxID=3871 RepID=UPI00092E5A90|nr:PREDICTED: uncharacterized protein LOC109363626 [Lupinus angustifolius]
MDVYFDEMSSWKESLRKVQNNNSITQIHMQEDQEVTKELNPDLKTRSREIRAAITRPTRTRHLPLRLSEFEMFVVDVIIDEGDLIHLALQGGTWEAEIRKLKGKLKSEFKMSVLEELAYFLGIEFSKTDKRIIIHQRKYTTYVLDRLQMLSCKPALVLVEGNLKLSETGFEFFAYATLYRQIVGCLRFICHSRPETTYGVGMISKHIANSTQSHMIAAKRIRRYLKGTLCYGVLFPNQKQNCESVFVGCSDLDWCRDKKDKRSTLGYLFTIFGAPISWSSRKHDVVALLTYEAEYIATCNATCQGLWLMYLMT